MNKLILVGLTCTSLLVALPEKGYCHGGQYRGPGDVVPPNLSDPLPVQRVWTSGILFGVTFRTQ